ncbi:MAG: IPT/TIG domain-containing protein [Terriglobia bacterium]
MISAGLSLPKNWLLKRLAAGALFLCVTLCFPAWAAPQAGSDIPADATPQIQQITPSQAAAGDRVMVMIQGSNFASGAYVSSVSPAIKVDSSKRFSATQVEAELTISASAQPSTVSLLVSNPASRAAETGFTIVGGQAPGAPAAPAAAPTLAVSAVEPVQVGTGFEKDLKITGQNFVLGAKVSFANPGIRVLGVIFTSSTELTTHIKVAPDAATGVSSLFVINPDQTEVETQIEVTGKTAATPAAPATPPAPGSPAAPAAPATPAATVSADTQRYDAFHLGSPTEMFQTHGKVKGSLVVSAGTITYQEAGKTLVNIAISDVKEIKVSAVVPNTFHITLNSGKTYHFAPGSARPADARNLVDLLRQALPH